MNLTRAALLLIAPLALSLAGCGSSQHDASAPAPAETASQTGSPTGSPTAGSTAGAGASATASTSAPAMPTVQPCDALKPAAIKKVLGYAETIHTGTAQAPSCAMTPAVKGGAVFQLNYSWWYKGGLDAAWDSMRKQISGKATTIAVPGADSARLVINRAAQDAVYVTGFVQNGALLQLVDGEARPRDLAVLKAGVVEIMRQLSAGAPTAGPTVSR